jgi:hypothetical protein
MKLTAVVLSLNLGLFAVSALGQGSAVIIKNRAKETVNQNNVRQGVPPPSQTPPPPAPTPAVPAPGLSPAQSAAKLKAAVAARTTKPSLPTVTKFVDSLAGGLSEATLTGEQQARLAQNIEAVLNSKPLPAAQFDAIIADVQAILQVGSVKRATATTIAGHLKAVGAEVRR